jgi:hypothetical protein
MPFTPAHAALVLPFIRVGSRYISATGLIIGSMSPDFEYFFRMSPDADHGHTLAGLLYFDLPVTSLLALLFHLVVKRRLIGHLPAFLQARLQPLRQLDFTAYLKNHALVFGISALVGAASHLFWDAFTHSDGYFVRRLPFYHQRYVPFEGVNYPLWYALQNISSWVGLTLVVIYILSLKPRPGEVGTPSLWYWPFILAVSCLVVGLRFQFELSQARIGDLVIASISGLCVAVVLAGVIPFRPVSGYSQ